MNPGSFERIAAEQCRRLFFRFVQEFWETIIADEPVYNWHIPYLCDELQYMAELVMIRKDSEGNIIKKRQPKEYDLIINIPPGTTKSTIVTIMFPVWCWTVDPTLKFITGSYSMDLSMEHAVKARDIINSDKFKAYYPELSLKLDQNNKSSYSNNFKGTRVACSVGGTITGKHGHILIADDLINPKKAASKVELKTTNSWMDETLSPRKVDKACSIMILMMQRLDEDDPTGHMLLKKGKKIKHICLPAQVSDNVKPPELKAKYVNGLLDPVRMSAAVLADMLLDLGSYGYAGQMDQEPAPASGGIWKKWFKVIPDQIFPSASILKNYGRDWDTAYTESENNAASAYVASGMHPENNRMYIDDLDFSNKEYPELIKWMLELPGPHYIEGKATGKSSKQTLNRMGVAAIEIPVTGGDKVQRARNATPFAESGMICVRASLIEKLYNHHEQGILKFPNNKKADLQDALTQAIQRHFSKKRFGAPPRTT